MPAVEIAVLFFVVAVLMAMLGGVALLLQRRGARRAAGRTETAGPQPPPGSTSATSPAPAPPASSASPADRVPTEPTAPDPVPAEPAAAGPTPGEPAPADASPTAAPSAGRRPAAAPGLPTPLAEQSRQRFLTAWTGVQHRFEDSPVLALSQADALLSALLAERGLPGDGMRTQADLPAGASGQLLEEFRLGHLIEQSNSTRRADLAQINVGMEHFRRVFEELVREPGLPGPTAQPASAGDRDTSR